MFWVMKTISSCDILFSNVLSNKNRNFSLFFLKMMIKNGDDDDKK